MKIWIFLIIMGQAIAILGIIFHFQGQSMVGPESSFMYANQEWITYGMEILILGIVVTFFGFLVRIVQI
jgi:hypothetical protein